MEGITEIVNLTKKQLNLLSKDGTTISIPSNGEVAVTVQRLEFEGLKATYSGHEIKANSTKFNTVRGLPQRKPGVIIIVPSFVYFQVFLERDDVFVVDEPVKNERSEIRLARAISRPTYTYVNNKLIEISNLVSKLSQDNLEEEKRVEILYRLKTITDSFKCK